MSEKEAMPRQDRPAVRAVAERITQMRGRWKEIGGQVKAGTIVSPRQLVEFVSLFMEALEVAAKDTDHLLTLNDEMYAALMAVTEDLYRPRTPDGGIVLSPETLLKVGHAIAAARKEQS